jgi:hypothetical protein
MKPKALAMSNIATLPTGYELPSVEELCELILHALHALGGSGFKGKIYDKIVMSKQIPRDLGASKQRKMKYRLNRSLIDLEKCGLVENSEPLNGVWSLTTKGSANFDAIDDIETNRPDRVIRSGAVYTRNLTVRAAVMKRAKGKCEFCGELGFARVDGTSYLECHHILALAKDGADRMTNVIALCANHHREAHFGEQRDEIEKRMILIVRLANRVRRGLDKAEETTS